MPLVYDVKDIKGNAGNSGDLFKDSLSNARASICSAYKNRPKWFSDEVLDLDKVSIFGAIGRFGRQQMDNFCSDQPLPPPPTKPFTGGQCACSTYVVSSVYSSSKTPSSPNQDRTVTAPILGIVVAPGVSGQMSDYLAYSVCTNGVVTGTATTPLRVHDVDANGNPIGSSAITRVVRGGGLTDSCGDPDPTDPRDGTPMPPNFTFNPTVPQPRLPSATINVPVVILPPVIIKPTANLNFSFNIPINIGGVNFNFSGDKITFADGDTNINQTVLDTVNNNTTTLNTAISNSQTNVVNNINASATNIRTNVKTDTTALINSSTTSINSNTNSAITSNNATINNNTNSSISSAITAINNNTNSSISVVNNNTLAVSGKVDTAITKIDNNTVLVRGDITALATVLALVQSNTALSLNVINLISKNQEDCICPPPLDDPTLTPVRRPNNERANDNPAIQAVTITLTKLPVKGLWGGGGGAPDKHIAGWFAWKIKGGGYAPQMPINYASSTFVRPGNVVGYSYTLTNGALGYATEYNLTS